MGPIKLDNAPRQGTISLAPVSNQGSIRIAPPAPLPTLTLAPSTPASAPAPQQQIPHPSLWQSALNIGKGIVQSAVNPADKFLNDIGALGLDIGALGQAVAGKRITLDTKANKLLQPGGGLGHQGGVLGGGENTSGAVFIGPNAVQNIKKTVGVGAQLGSLVAAGGAGLGEGALGVRVAKGVLMGSGINTVGSVGQQLADNGSVSLKPTLQSAAFGGILGGGVPVLAAGARGIHSYDLAQNEIGAVGRNVNPEGLPKSEPPTAKEFAMGKALGMSKDDVIKAKAAGPNDALASTRITPTDNALPIKISKSEPPTSKVANPLRGTVSVPKVQEGDLGQAHLNADTVFQHEQFYGQRALTAYQGLSSHDQVLLKDIETKSVSSVAKSAQDPEAFNAAVGEIRHYYDLRDAYDQYLGITHGYRTNYLRQIFDQTEQAQEPVKTGGGNLNPAYTKARKYDTLGADVGEALQKDISGATFNHAKIVYQNGLEEAAPGKISAGDIMRGENGVYSQLKTNFGKELTASPEIAAQINARAPYERPLGLGHVPGQIYDSVNGFQKGAKLALGGFHDVASYAAYLIKSVFSGDIRNAYRPLIAKIRPEYYDNLRQGFIDNGSMNKFRLSGLTINDVASDAGGSVLLKGKFNPVRAVHDSLFKRELPAMKMIIADSEMRNLDPNLPADLVRMRGISRALNNGIGGINRAVDGLTPKELHTAGRFILATDYNEGQIRATLAALTKGGDEGRLSRQIIGGKIALFALPGLVAVAADPNQRDKPEVWAKALVRQIFDPQVPTPWKNAKGEQQVQKFPGDPAITKGARIIAPLFDKNQVGLSGKTSGLQHEAIGNLAALPASAVEVKTNKDYYGNPIVVRNSDGSINIKKTTASAALSQAPISVNQISRAAQGIESPGQAAVNVIGFGRSATNPDDPQYVRNQKYFQQLADYKRALQNGDFGSIDQAAAGFDKKFGPDFVNDYNAIHPANTKDPAGNSIPRVWNALSGEQKATYYLANDQKTGAQVLSPVFYVDQKLSQMDPNRPHDPLFDLQGNGMDANGREVPKAQVAIEYTNNQDRGARTILQNNNPWLADYQQTTSNYFSNYKPALTSYMQQQGWSQQAISDYWSKRPSNPSPFAYPQQSQGIQELMKQASDITDPALKSQFYKDNPQVLDAYDQIAKYNNQVRNARGLPEYQDYPAQSDHVKQVLDSLPSGTDKASKKARALIFQSNPDVEKFLNDVAVWNLNKSADIAQYKGQTYDQSGLKAIEQVAKYGIVSNPDGSLALKYGPGAQAGATPISGFGGGTGSQHKSRIAPRPPRVRTSHLRIKHAPRQRTGRSGHLAHMQKSFRTTPVRGGIGATKIAKETQVVKVAA